ELGQHLRADGVAEVRSLEELHGHVQEAEALLLAEVVDGDDVGVGEEGRGLGLALEALARLVARPGRGGERLDRDVAIEDGVERLVDPAHRPVADLAEYLVLADPLDFHPLVLGGGLPAVSLPEGFLSAQYKMIPRRRGAPDRGPRAARRRGRPG